VFQPSISKSGGTGRVQRGSHNNARLNISPQGRYQDGIAIKINGAKWSTAEYRCCQWVNSGNYWGVDKTMAELKTIKVERDRNKWSDETRFEVRMNGCIELDKVSHVGKVNATFKPQSITGCGLFFGVRRVGCRL